MIDEIRRLRARVSGSLAETLGSCNEDASEVEIRDAWHERLHSDSALTDDGWYLPPPHGIILAIGNPPGFTHVNNGTFRPTGAWPSNANRLGSQALMFAYASPVERSTGYIGDLACSLYRGTDQALQSHLAKVWNLTCDIAAFAEIGMTFADVYRYAQRTIVKANLSNIVVSVHDGSDTDIGHTIPWSHAKPTAEELRILEEGSSQNIADLVSGKRLFLNGNKHTTIGPDCAFTIEPRLAADGLPMVSFHQVVGFAEGRKHLITEFDPLFELFEMSYLD